MFSGGGGISASPEGRGRDWTWEERKERKYQGLKEREVGRCVGPETNSSWATFWILRNDGRWGQSSQHSFAAHLRPREWSSGSLGTGAEWRGHFLEVMSKLSLKEWRFVGGTELSRLQQRPEVQSSQQKRQVKCCTLPVWLFSGWQQYTLSVHL